MKLSPPLISTHNGYIRVRQEIEKWDCKLKLKVTLCDM